MIVYADVLFFINFIMDVLCLYICAKVLNFKIKKLRLVVASIIGALYGVFSAVFLLWEPLCSIAASTVMILVCFDFKRIFVFAKALILMHCVGMLSGGIMTFLSRIIYENRYLKVFANGIDMNLFMILFGIMLTFIYSVSGIFGVYFHRRSVICTLYTETASKTVKLLMDTGNVLKDPYTDKPVVIVKKDTLDGLLGEHGIHRCYKDCSTESAVENRLRFINAKTISGSVLLPILGSVRIKTGNGNDNQTELFAAVAADVTEENDYGGNDGVIPYMLESSF